MTAVFAALLSKQATAVSILYMLVYRLSAVSISALHASLQCICITCQADQCTLYNAMVQLLDCLPVLYSRLQTAHHTCV
jgi:hypothetical protein